MIVLGNPADRQQELIRAYLIARTLNCNVVYKFSSRPAFGVEGVTSPVGSSLLLFDPRRPLPRKPTVNCFLESE